MSICAVTQKKKTLYTECTKYNHHIWASIQKSSMKGCHKV